MTDTLSAAELRDLALNAAQSAYPAAREKYLHGSGATMLYVYDGGLWVFGLGAPRKPAPLSARMTPENLASVSTLARALLASRIATIVRGGWQRGSYYWARDSYYWAVIGTGEGLIGEWNTEAEARNALLDTLLPESPEVTQ